MEEGIAWRELACLFPYGRFGGAEKKQKQKQRRGDLSGERAARLTQGTPHAPAGATPSRAGATSLEFSRRDRELSLELSLKLGIGSRAGQVSKLSIVVVADPFTG